MGNNAHNKRKTEYNIKFIGEIKIGEKSYIINKIKEKKLFNIKKYSKETNYKITIKNKNNKFIFNLIDGNDESEKNELKEDCIILEYNFNSNNSLENIKSTFYNKIKYNKQRPNLIFLVGIKTILQDSKEKLLKMQIILLNYII